jgi:hypothetical protein
MQMLEEVTQIKEPEPEIQQQYTTQVVVGNEKTAEEIVSEQELIEQLKNDNIGVEEEEQFVLSPDNPGVTAIALCVFHSVYVFFLNNTLRQFTYHFTDMTIKLQPKTKFHLILMI